MMTFLRWASVIVASVFLRACAPKVMTYSDWMADPAALQKAYGLCEQDNKSSRVDCEVVRHAMQDHTALLDEQEQMPETFGMKVLQAQQQLAGLQQEYAAAKKQNDLAQLKLMGQAVKDQADLVQAYYAVLAQAFAEGAA